ncbi:MAG: hypothetical protein AABM64_00810 [Pseudomonadota bacterium]
MNRVYKRSGSLWEGRFCSSLLQSEQYVLACYRYIEMNPIRANMVQHPGGWRVHERPCGIEFRDSLHG